MKRLSPGHKKIDWSRVEFFMNNILDFIGGHVTLQDMQGSVWYQTENKNIRVQAKELGVNADVFAAMVAILSPGLDWQLNLLGARNIVLRYHDMQSASDDFKIVGYGQNVRKAERLYDQWYQGNLDQSVFDFIGDYDKTPKTRAFAKNLARPFDSLEITIDAWMMRVAMKEYRGPIASFKCSAPDFRAIYEAYLQVWAALDLESHYVKPHMMQAAIWEEVRRPDVGPEYFPDCDDVRIVSAFRGTPKSEL